MGGLGVSRLWGAAAALPAVVMPAGSFFGFCFAFSFVFSASPFFAFTVAPFFAFLFHFGGVGRSFRGGR